MAKLIPTTRTVTILLLCCAALCISARAQTETAPETPSASQPIASPKPSEDGDQKSAAEPDKPIPDIVAMMNDVQSNQRKAEAIQKDYLYHSVETEQEVDDHGKVKKTTVTEYDHLWINGVPMRRLVKKNGKALTPEEIAKEDERIDKDSAKARERRERQDAKGNESTARGDEEITVSRLIALGAFTNPRRVQLNGRDTIAVDYAGDPKAKTRNRAEEVIRDLVGTAWIDEQDHMLARVEGHFANAYKVGFGVVADIRKDTHFVWQQTKVNNEVWLPSNLDAQGAARFLLFFSFNGSVRAVESDYRKFRATSTILPVVTQVETQEEPGDRAKP